VLWLRSLEPADAPVNFGTKLALAIGTARRLEHDEAERVFGFCCADPAALGGDDRHAQKSGVHPYGTTTGPADSPGSVPIGGGIVGRKGTPPKRQEVEVFVREKVRVETADPSLLSLSAKLVALANTLGTARRNLAAVMGEELED
jgi:hypothetical protein